MHVMDSRVQQYRIKLYERKHIETFSIMKNSLKENRLFSVGVAKHFSGGCE